MTLRYNVGDIVVLGDNVDVDLCEKFTPGTKVRIVEKCLGGRDGDHYTVVRLEDGTALWWVYDHEINHGATAMVDKGVNSSMNKSYFMLFGDNSYEMDLEVYPDKESLLEALEEAHANYEHVRVIYGEEVKVKTKYILCEEE